jgi:fluoride ion exporter CrcB/FEX
MFAVILPHLGGIMKVLSLLMWVTQFGLSIIFPTLFFLLLAVWLQNKFNLGMWIIVVFGFLGVLTTISTTKSCLRSLCKAADEASSGKEHPVAFNDHS